MATLPLGREARIYYKAAPHDGGGAWQELRDVRNVTLNREGVEFDASTRATKFKMTATTMIDLSLEFDMIYTGSNAGLSALLAAAMALDPIALQVRTRPDGPGLQADWVITSFPESQQLEEGITVSFTAKPAYSASPPTEEIGA